MTDGSAIGAWAVVCAGLLDGQASRIAIAAAAAASAAPAPHIQGDDERTVGGGIATSGSGDASAKRAASRSMWVASLPEKASTHCVPEIKSWSARDGSTFSMRTGSTAFFLLIARSTSRATKSDSLLALDRRSEERRVGKECRCRWA